MNQTKILLVDLRKYSDESHVLKPFESQWSVRHMQKSYECVATEIQIIQPQILYFEYDFPDIPTLQVMKECKVFYPSIPIVMVTKQHSEGLAVWAHRARIWDYFVKPVPREELIDCQETLSRLLTVAIDHGKSRQLVPRSCRMPEDVRFRNDRDESDGKEIRSAIEYINRMLTQKITQSDAAKACNMNVWQFSRCFKKCYEMTFQEYVVRRRMQEAMRLLENPSAAVTDVCFAVGYTDLSYFTRTFRRYIGTSPSLYKTQLNDVRLTLNEMGARSGNKQDLQRAIN